MFWDVETRAPFAAAPALPAAGARCTPGHAADAALLRLGAIGIGFRPPERARWVLPLWVAGIVLFHVSLSGEVAIRAFTRLAVLAWPAALLIHWRWVGVKLPAALVAGVGLALAVSSVGYARAYVQAAVVFQARTRLHRGGESACWTTTTRTGSTSKPVRAAPPFPRNRKNRGLTPVFRFSVGDAAGAPKTRSISRGQLGDPRDAPGATRGSPARPGSLARSKSISSVPFPLRKNLNGPWRVIKKLPRQWTARFSPKPGIAEVALERNPVELRGRFDLGGAQEAWRRGRRARRAAARRLPPALPRPARRTARGASVSKGVQGFFPMRPRRPGSRRDRW